MLDLALKKQCLNNVLFKSDDRKSNLLRKCKYYFLFRNISYRYYSLPSPVRLANLNVLSSKCPFAMDNSLAPSDYALR